MLKSLRAALTALLLAISLFPQAACAAPAQTTVATATAINVTSVGAISAARRRAAALASPLRLGVNLAVPAPFTYSPPLTDIAISAPGVTAQEWGGFISSPSGNPVPDANREAHGNVISVPGGQTSISFVDLLPASTAQRKLIWTCTVSSPCTGSFSITNSTSPAIDQTGRSVIYTPVGTQSNGSQPPVFNYTPSSTSNYPINFIDRPVVDSGAVLSPEFVSVVTADTSATKVMRFMDDTTVNRNNSPLVEAGAGATISSITHSGAVATVTTATAHGLLGNGTAQGSASVVVTGASPAAYNVTDAYVNVIDATHFSYTMGSTPASNATTVGSYAYGDANAQFWKLKNPSIGSEPGTLLGEPIYTAANRNKNKADGEWHDGVPVETLASIAAAAHANAWYTVPPNADATFYADVATVWANFAATNNLDVYEEVGNEPFNPGFAWYHQLFNEAVAAGITTDQRYAQKSIQVADYFRTAFASAGASSHLHVVLSWQNYGSPTVWTSMSSFLGSTDWAKVTDLSVAPYYGDNDNMGIAVGYNGSTATLKAAISADVDDTINHAVGHLVAAQALGKRLIFYEGGHTTNFSDHTYGPAFERSSDAYDLEAKFLQQLELKVAAQQTGGIDLASYNLSYPLGINNFSWGQVEYLSQTLSKATTPKLWAHVDFKSGIRVLSAATGALNDTPSTAAVGTSIGFLNPSAYGVTWSLTDNDGNRVSIVPATGEVKVAAGLSGTASGARSLTARQALGASIFDTVVAYNVAPLFLDNFNDNSRDSSLWPSLAGFAYGDTSTIASVLEQNSRLEVIPSNSGANAGGYLSGVKDVTNKAYYIKVVAPGDLFSHDEMAYFSIGTDANHYIGIRIASSRLTAYRYNAGTADFSFSTYDATTMGWIKIAETPSGWKFSHAAASLNPPATGDWVDDVTIAYANDGGLDPTHAKIGFGAYTWDGDRSATPVVFDGFNTAQ